MKDTQRIGEVVIEIPGVAVRFSVRRRCGGERPDIEPEVANDDLRLQIVGERSNCSAEEENGALRSGTEMR